MFLHPDTNCQITSPAMISKNISTGLSSQNAHTQNAHTQNSNILELCTDLDSPTFYRDILDIVSAYVNTKQDKKKHRCHSIRLHISPEIRPRIKFIFAKLNLTGYYRTWSILKITPPTSAPLQDIRVKIHTEKRYIELHLPKEKTKKKNRGDVIKTMLVKDHLIPALSLMYPTKVFRWGKYTKRGIFSVITIGNDALHMKKSCLSKIIL